MAEDETLRLALRDVYGKPLRTSVDLFFRNQTLQTKGGSSQCGLTRTAVLRFRPPKR